MEPLRHLRVRPQPLLPDHRGVHPPIKHGNDRVEWFVQLSDEIEWKWKTKSTGLPRAKAIMKAGDVAAMPANIRHQGFSKKRSMLLDGKRDA